jgi:ligand-binding sensor domain-containing protein
MVNANWMRDPNLIRFERERQFPVGHAAARRVVFGREGRLFVAAGKSVLVFAPDGQREADWVVGEQVRCLRVDQSGAVWIGVKDRLLVFDAKGQRTARWDAFGGKAYLTGLAVSERDVWVADSGNRVIYRCDRQGRVELRVGRTES